MVWKYFVYIFLAYWISGMTLSSGYFGDLNHWFVFALSLLYTFGTQSGESPVRSLSPAS